MERNTIPQSSTDRWPPGFSARHLLSTIEGALLGPSPPSPSQRVELVRTLRSASPVFQALLTYPPPKAADRAQVQSKEVRLPDLAPILLDDMDVQIALKLSDELNLNEIDCVRLLLSANQEWTLLGREPLEIFRLAAGLWYTERRDLITSLYTVLRAVVLDQGLEPDLVADVQNLLEELLCSSMRQKLITLIKELNREDSTGFGGPNAEAFVLDSRGALVGRKAVVFRERLSLGHCLVFSALVVRMNPKDVKSTFSALKDCTVDVSKDDDYIELQITFSLLFSLVIAFMSDALSTVPDKASILSNDSSFRHEFQDTVIAPLNNSTIDGFVDVVRLGWTVHLILTQEHGSSWEMANIRLGLELICSHNVFHFLLTKVLQSSSYQNDDEDVICVYTAYLHKLMMCFLSHSLGRDKVKDMKEKAMIALNPYSSQHKYEARDGASNNFQQFIGMECQPFVSLLELLNAIYQKEPELLLGNDDLWSFVNFAGEDHTNIQTLVAFLGLLSTLSSTEEGAWKVYELLQGKTFRSISWNTLFECLSIYEQKFKQTLQNAGTMLPDFQEGDARALVAYLNVLQKVVENGNPNERKNWFTDIEPLFKLLSYENVPPYLKGALRDAILVFIPLSPTMKQSIWSYLEQYDLPVVIGPSSGMVSPQMGTQIYDMRYELNEVEAKLERYPSTISFLNLLNALIARETDVSDRGRRFIGIFRFVYDHVFGSFTQRAYADPCEKWKLAIACLQHFKLLLSMYDIRDEDAVLFSPPSGKSGHAPIDVQLPVLELLKDFMSGKIAFHNVMRILSLGASSVIHDRTSQIYGQYLETAICLSLEIVILVLERDSLLSDYWRPMYQTLDAILSQNPNHIVTLLEFVRYNLLPQIQQCSIKIMTALSARMVGLVQLLLKVGVAKYLVEDYATCLELRIEESLILDNAKEDTGVLIMQLLLDNISRPAPNITHLLLSFDMDSPVEGTVLRPKFHYSCLKVILDSLEILPRPSSNSLLFEFGFQLLYELCLDPLMAIPTMELLSSKRYVFFAKHLETLAAAPLPKRNNQVLRISSLHQRAWLLKLLALELHVADLAVPTHREACSAILSQIFSQGTSDLYKSGLDSMRKIKALELLDVVMFRSPETGSDYSEIVSNLKYDLRVEDILKNPITTEKGGVYYYSDRGDRLIDLVAFHDKLWQMCNISKSQPNSINNTMDVNVIRESVQQLIRWGWKYNKNLEEQAAQLHMLVGWSQVVEVTVSRRMMLLDARSHVLFELLEFSLNAASSPDCSLKFALILSQVALTCMAKLRDERFLFPGGIDSDNITCLDVIISKQLPNGACQSILFKLTMCILRNDSSELLRRRLYALLLCYFQYCASILDPDIPASVLQFLLRNDENEVDYDLHKIDRDHADLVQANFSILKKESQALFDVVVKDSIQGSEPSRTLSFFVFDALISIDLDRFFLNQIQSRGILRSCLSDFSNFSSQSNGHYLDSLQRLCTLEAKFSFLVRVSHRYKKLGAEVLLSMDALEHLTSLKFVDLHLKGTLRRSSMVRGDVQSDVKKQRQLITPVLRLVSSLTSLVDLSEFFEVKNKIVHQVVEFVKARQPILDQILTIDVVNADEELLDQLNLVVSILGKIWPYEENDTCGFLQELFGMMHAVFPFDIEVSVSYKTQRRRELTIFRIMLHLSSYLYFLVKRKSLRLQITDGSDEGGIVAGKVQPTLLLVLSLLMSSTKTLEHASEEKILLLGKIQDINELSRQEVDDIISMFKKQDCISASDNVRKRRYIAMVEMCHIVGIMEQLISLSLQLAEHALNILLMHFQENLTDYGDTHDCSLLCGKALPTLERLEQLMEDKVGHNLKVFHRSVAILKEMAIRNLTI